ncbi:MAG: glycosyltransferase [Propionibacteriales bacterium]|nr:glycosyltransferase [Propionibacteriales bacterium]
MTIEQTARQLSEVTISPAPLERLAELLTPEQSDRLRSTIGRAHDLLDERIVWNINSTASGGGVAEMLQALIAYACGAQIDARWLVVQGDAPFFALTKRLHNFLHGAPGDGGQLGPDEHAVYAGVLREHRADLLQRVRRGDVVILHDPQTAGLVDILREAGAHVIWRCHIGADQTTQHTDQAWAFLRTYVESADALVFTRAEYAPDWVAPERLRVIAPSIDPFSLKNCDLEPEVVNRILRTVGLAPDGRDEDAVTFQGRDGSSHAVRRHTDLEGAVSTPPPADAPLVVQVSRWDRLKDMAGVMTAFTGHVADVHRSAHLLLVGPDVSGVADDPEGAAVLDECVAQWERLPDDVRRRVHLVRVPMDDLDENAIIVNAIQRRAAVVVQKSFAEGFGLTVTEAMWKGRPMVAGAVGGIPDQVDSGVHGILVDPRDTQACGEAVSSLLANPDQANQLGSAARDRVLAQFLGDRHLRQYIELFGQLID